MKISPEMIDAMMSSGLTAEQVLMAVKAMSSVRSSDAIRKARSRANVTDCHGQSRPFRDNPDIPDSPLSPLSPLDKETPPKPPKEINPPYTPQTPAAFASFWAAFPNKVGKADAFKAFDRAVKRVDIVALMAGLDRYVSKTDDRPWCNPATWLNQDRWTDVPATVARGSPAKGPTLSERFAQLGQFANERQNGNGIEAPQQTLRLVSPSPTDK